MVRSSGDDMILSYNDTVLRRSDLDILSGPYFLNDRIIEFYFSYLSSSYLSDGVHLVAPSTAFWLQNCADKETLKAFIEPLNLATKELVIFPVNNNDDVTQAEGGSHWSLIVFYKAANVFVHHDSFGQSNSKYSRKLYSSVVEFVANSSSGIKYVEHQSSPQQKNGYDCGLFVLAIASVICSWYTSNTHVDGEHIWLCSVEDQVTQSTVSELRKEILNLILGLMPGRTNMQTANPNESQSCKIRRLEITDKSKGFIELLRQLTVCDSVSDVKFEARFRELSAEGDNHVICVVEDNNTGRIIATGSVFIEKKFIRNCGQVGHIEDVVVDASARGMNLGKKVIEYLTAHAQLMGCYKVILDCNAQNTAFYQKCGFKQKEIQMVKYFC
ncbi:hypothetical protein vseg_015207 [Gypsophila vaccaria]